MRRLMQVLCAGVLMSVVAVSAASAAPTLKVWGPLVGQGPPYVGASAAQPIYIYAAADTGQVGLSVTVTVDTTIIKQYGCGSCTTLGQLPGKGPEGGNPPPAATFSTQSPTTEGEHTLKVDLVTGPPTVTTRQTSAFRVDRTPPSAPSGFAQGIFYPTDADHVATITFASADPDLPGPVPGSGVKSYNVRYRVNGGAFSAWQATDAPQVDVPNAAVGQAVTVEATATDAVGNVSAVGSAVLTLTARAEDPAIEDMAAQSIVDEFGGTLAAAKAWYAVQVRANGIGEAIGTTASGPGYAGTWFDNAARKMIVNLKTGTPAAGAQAAIDSAGLTADSQIRFVSASLDQLDQAFPQVSSQLNSLVAAQLIEVSRDDQGAALHIDVGTDTTAAQRAQVNSVAAAASVPVTVTLDTVANYQLVLDRCTTAAVEGTGTRKVPICDDPLRGGVHIGGYTTATPPVGQGLCTAGFNVVSKSTGLPYVVTAGHCFGGYTNDNSRWASFPAEDPGYRIFIGANHNPYIDNDTGDIGLITVEPGSQWWTTSLKPKPWVFIQPARHQSTPRRTEAYKMRLVFTSYKGETLCWSGASTGGHCGRVINSSSRNKRFGVLEVGRDAPDCIAGGDSGAPVVKASSARGLAIAHTRFRPCHVYYQSAKLGFDALNVKLLTTAP